MAEATPTPGFSRCTACGRVFAKRPGKRLCRYCTVDREEAIASVERLADAHPDITPEELAVEAGLELDEVRDILRKHPVLKESIAIHETCASCGDRFAQPGSKYCLTCRMTLYKSLGDAAYTTQENVVEGKGVVPGKRPISVREALNEKRSRTGASAFNPSRGRVK